MENWILHNQLWFRFLCFVIIFSLLAWWEVTRTWRPWLTTRPERWLAHFSLKAIGVICTRSILPLFTISAAALAQLKRTGIFYEIHLVYPASVLLGIIAMDFAIYFQHRMLHKYKWLWAIHRVHHIDTQVDVSTGLRFHPLEEMFTMAMKVLAVAFFGVPILAAFIYEILLNMASLFTHVNAPIHPKLEKKLRLFLVTPDMHRIHHSDIPHETNSNYSFMLNIWDKIFGSYTCVPQFSESKLVFGLEEYRAPKYQTLINLLLLPFGLRQLKVWPRKNIKTKMRV